MLFASLYQLATSYLVNRFRRFELEPEARSRPRYPVTHLKPIHGAKPRTESNLRSFTEQDYDGEVEVVFSAGRLHDPATPVARGIAADDPRVKVVEGDASANCTNPKVASMIQGYPHCTKAFVLSTDSDMHAPEGYLNKVMEHFDDPQVGMVTALYVIQQVHRPTMALEALSILDFSVSVLVARALEGMSFGLGASMAFRREALEQIGGFRAVGEYLAEDYQLGNRLHKAGWKVKLAGVVLEDVLPDITFKEYFMHQLRWMRTYRISRPAGHFAFIVTQGSAWVLGLLALTGWSWSTALAALLWWQIRTRCTSVNWTALGGQDVPRWVRFVPLKDLIYLSLWVTSLVGDRVTWGNRELQIFPDGQMRRVA